MKTNRIIALLCLAGSFLSVSRASANDEVPCLIFTGNSDKEYCIDLATLNRITFGNEGMTISSSKDDTVEEVQLLYSLFHHLEIGNANPSGSSGIDEINADGNSRLIFSAETKSLVLESTSPEHFTVGIFNLQGRLIATSQVRAGQSLAVDELVTGVYIAVATNGETKLTLKFIIN